MSSISSVDTHRRVFFYCKRMYQESSGICSIKDGFYGYGSYGFLWLCSIIITSKKHFFIVSPLPSGHHVKESLANEQCFLSVVIDGTDAPVPLQATNTLSLHPLCGLTHFLSAQSQGQNAKWVQHVTWEKMNRSTCSLSQALAVLTLWSFCLPVVITCPQYSE